MYLTILLIYVAILLGVGYLTSRKEASNEAFFSGNHRSPWYLVAFGMIGASISGISVVSVPGMVTTSGWTYLQTCLGFFFGYVAVAYILLPLYYRLKLTSIYEYLNSRFGSSSYHTGSMFFVIAKLISSATKLYIAVLVLQHFIFDKWNVPFWLIVIICVTIIWLYTNRAGIKTIVWTDTLQTLFFIIAISLMCYEAWKLNAQFSTLKLLLFSNTTTTFIFDDLFSTQYFWKQFISGIFIVVVMTGLDQDMMQKNLSCKNLRDAQKNMYCYGFSFIPVNLAFLFLGACLVMLLQQQGIALPTASDQLVTTAIESGFFSPLAVLLFTLGIVAATCSSSDSALISITTAINIDFLPPSDAKTSEKRRKITHAFVCLGFILLLWGFYYMGNQNLLDTLFNIASYTYGPLLGIFAFGLFTRYQIHDKWVPIIAFIAPICCLLLQWITHNALGYELLLLNGFITFVGLLVIKKS